MRLLEKILNISWWVHAFLHLSTFLTSFLWVILKVWLTQAQILLQCMCTSKKNGRKLSFRCLHWCQIDLLLEDLCQNNSSWWDHAPACWHSAFTRLSPVIPTGLLELDVWVSDVFLTSLFTFTSRLINFPSQTDFIPISFAAKITWNVLLQQEH